MKYRSRVNCYYTLFLCWVPCHLGVSAMTGALFPSADAHSHSHLQLKLLPLILVAPEVGGPVLPTLRRWGPLPAAGTREELAGHPTGVQKPEFLIAWWEVCFVNRPEQDVGGITGKKTDLDQLISLMAAQGLWCCPKAE